MQLQSSLTHEQRVLTVDFFGLGLGFKTVASRLNASYLSGDCSGFL